MYQICFPPVGIFALNIIFTDRKSSTVLSPTLSALPTHGLVYNSSIQVVKWTQNVNQKNTIISQFKQTTCLAVLLTKLTVATSCKVYDLTTKDPTNSKSWRWCSQLQFRAKYEVPFCLSSSWS